MTGARRWASSNHGSTSSRNRGVRPRRKAYAAVSPASEPRGRHLTGISLESIEDFEPPAGRRNRKDPPSESSPPPPASPLPSIGRRRDSSRILLATADCSNQDSSQDLAGIDWSSTTPHRALSGGSPTPEETLNAPHRPSNSDPQRPTQDPRLTNIARGLPVFLGTQGPESNRVAQKKRRLDATTRAKLRERAEISRTEHSPLLPHETSGMGHDMARVHHTEHGQEPALQPSLTPRARHEMGRESKTPSPPTYGTAHPNRSTL